MTNPTTDPMTSVTSSATETLRQCVARQFAQDVRDHVLTVRLDQDVHRDLLCTRAGSGTYHFGITTWPGHLCVSGDMGTLVFARTRDMFAFFRDDGTGDAINPSYWAEKLRAPHPPEALEYDPDAFRARVREWVADHITGSDYDDVTRGELLSEVEEEVLSRADDGEDAAMRASCEFTFRGCVVFQDFWDAHCREYTYAFLWCCHAIVWAIARYDAQAAQEEAAEIRGRTDRGTHRD